MTSFWDRLLECPNFPNRFWNCSNQRVKGGAVTRLFCCLDPFLGTEFGEFKRLLGLILLTGGRPLCQLLHLCQRLGIGLMH